MLLQERYGNDGYTGWFKLLECLCSTENHFICCSDPNRLRYLAKRLCVKQDDIIPFLDLLASLDAIDSELWQTRVIWCQHLVDNLSEVYANRRREAPARPTPNLHHTYTTPTPDLHPTQPESDVVHSIPQESVVNETPKAAVDIPEWIDKDVWKGYIEMRRKIKKPPTDRALKMVVTTLSELREKGQDPNKVLDQSILHSWVDVFELKSDYKPSDNHRAKLPSADDLNDWNERPSKGVEA